MTRAIKDNQSTYFATLCSGVPGAYHAEDYVDWFMTRVLFPMFNGVHSARIPGDNVSNIVRQTLEPFKSNKVPMLWWIDPLTIPSDLEKYLGREGLKHEGESTGMGVDLSKLESVEEQSPGFQIRLVEDEEMMADWMRVAGSVFGLPPGATQECLRLFDHGFGENAQFQHYLGSLDGVAVATSSILYDGEVAGIYDVATLARVRRRGIGRMMTTIPLLKARERGCQIAVLQSSEMGRSVYADIGFQEYCKLTMYHKDYSST